MIEIIFTENQLNNMIALHSATFAFCRKENINGKFYSDDLVEILKLKGQDYLNYILQNFKRFGIISDEET